MRANEVKFRENNSHEFLFLSFIAINFRDLAKNDKNRHNIYGRKNIF